MKQDGSEAMYERDEMVKCTACWGRGYHRCACWPGDCICGQDDEDCEGCDGTGWVWPDQDEPCRASCGCPNCNPM